MRITQLACFVLSLVLAAGTDLHAADTQSQQLLDTVRRAYSQSRKAVANVEYTYEFTLNEMKREARYARNGEKFYHASVGHLPGNGLSMPNEVAWDGQIASRRAATNILSYKRDPEFAKPACPTPEDEIADRVDQALGLVAQPRLKLVFVSARETTLRDLRGIELTFRWDPKGYVMKVFHAEALGYWPVYLVNTRPNGSVEFEIPEIRYKSAVVDGNEVFYPVYVVSAGEPGTDRTALTTFEIDEATLRFGQALPPERFRIEPWPCDLVGDMDRLTTRSPVDAGWLPPPGKAGFPWDLMIEAIGRTPQAAAAATAEERSPAGAAPAPTPAPMATMQPADPARTWRAWLIVGGVVIAAIAARVAYLQRKAA